MTARCTANERRRLVAGGVAAGIGLLALTASFAARPSTGTADPDAAMSQPHFVTGDECMACHNGLTAPTGEDVSIGTDWRASMMANSAKDPYWQAAVRRETIDHPSAKAAIEDECSRCHMPMANVHERGAGRKASVFSHLPIDRAVQGRLGPTSTLAADGVSCAVCHQIADEGLGTRESYTGGFEMSPPTSEGLPRMYGPFEVRDGHKAIMRSATLYEPAQGEHVQRSELCATCHTLYTHSLGPQGEVVGELPEQVPYLEWRHSDYEGRKSCQSCHMPVVSAETPIASVLGDARQGLSRHSFRGGNFFMLRMLSRYRAELGVTVSSGELEAAAQRTIRHLRQASARLSVSSAELREGTLRVEVRIENLAGHKLPTAYPSRRVWLQLRVVDRAGEVVFESGELEPSGAISGNDNDTDGSQYEPHYEEITSPDQVQIYEAIMVDTEGDVTTGLLTGTRFVKDNRLLPAGFDPDTAEDDIAVQGRARDDDGFDASGDVVRYSVAADDDAGPYEVRAELWYQPIAYRWAHNLASYESTETRRFVRYYESMSAGSGTMLARATARSTEPEPPPAEPQETASSAEAP